LPALENLKRSLFWIVARTCFTLYRWFPLFGLLRASIGIIHRNGEFLVIERNDGRGFSLPGGISGWKEAEEETLRREVTEETGMTVTSFEFRMRYRSTTDVPCIISVFEVQATGEPRNSWEGSPRWMALTEIQPRLVKSQRPVLELFTRMSSAVPDKRE
jgi:8-oxo-dGTP pyrophosphatase MutT (NUDIX family)